MPPALLLLCALGAEPEARPAKSMAEELAILDEHIPDLEFWWLAVEGLHLTMVATGATFYNVVGDSPVSIDLRVNLLGSSLGALSILPIAPWLHVDLDALHAMPESSEAEREEKALAVHRALERARGSVAFTQSWIPRVLSALYVIGMSLLQGLVFDRPASAIGHLLGGLIIGQGRLLLQPDGILEPE